MKKVILIGSRGFIGSYIYKQLSKHKKFIVHEGYKENINILKKNSFITAFNKVRPDYIINTAAFSHLDPLSLPEIFKINCNAIIDIIDFLEKSNFQGKFINTSSALIYGSKINGKIKETDNYNPEYKYAIAKAAVDKVIDELGDKIECISVRPFNCIGIGHREDYLVPKIVNHFREKKRTITLGNIQTRRDYVDVRDVSRMYVEILNTKKRFKSYNLATGKSFSAQSIINKARKITGHRIQVSSNKNLIRSNDAENVCGSNVRIKSIGFQYKYEIEDTLKWMIFS